MAETVEAGHAPPANEVGVGVEGNIDLGELAGHFLQGEQSPEAAEASEGGDATSDERVTSDVVETTGDDTDAVFEPEEGVEAGQDSTDTDESDDGDDDVLSDDLSEAGKTKLVKRVNKLTARAKSAEEKLEAEREAFQKQIDELKEQVSQPTEKKQADTWSERVAQAETPQELLQMQQVARETKKWVRAHQHEEFSKLGEQELDQEQKAAMLNEAEDMLEQEIPARAQYLQQREIVEQNTVKDFPAWRDTKHPDHQLLHRIWNDPVSKGMFQGQPNGRYLASIFAKGIRALEAEGQAQAAPPAEEKAPAKKQVVAPKVPGMDGGNPPVPGNRSNELEKRILSKGNVSTDDFVALLAAKG